MRVKRVDAKCGCWILCFLFSLLSLRAQSFLGASGGDGVEAAADPEKPGDTAGVVRTVKPAGRAEVWVPPDRGTAVDWDGLSRQSSLFLAVEHAFRLATEPDTRAGLRGPFFRGWMQSAGNLHGWSDGDPFYVNYIGHPMQGAVSGYIWTHNDRSYIGAEIGRNSFYWKSRLRATAYSWAYSTMFEIGPFSEASLGKIQSRYPQQGFVDHVVTPVIGLGWMIGEDALDKYVIQRFEEKFENPWLRLLVRGALNPSRSFANAMRFKVPWARDDRPGVFSPVLTSYLSDKRAGVIPPRTSPRPELVSPFGVSTFELAATARPVFYGSHTGVCIAGGGEAAFRLSSSWQFVADVSGCKLNGLGPNRSGDTLSYLFGPRWSARPAARWNPYAHLLVGGLKVTHEHVDPVLRDELRRTARIENRNAYDDHALYARRWEANGFSVAAGTGMDLRLNPAVALRVANLEYRKSWLPPLNGRSYNNGVALTMAVVLRTGTW
ncbi:MAG: hypothetical protein ACP5UT_01545 [Bryobacteraceae bacterium]